MKAKSRFTTISLAMVLFVLLIGSCAKDDSLLNPEEAAFDNMALKSAILDVVSCDLVAGQYINVGTVTYGHDEDNLIVSYFTSGDWTFKELHLYVGTLDGLPRNKNGIQIGQFPFSKTNLNGVNSWTFTIKLSELSSDEKGYTIAAHAVVLNKEAKDETAWANCTYIPIITLKTRFTNGEWAATDGTRFSKDFDGGFNWCWWLGTNKYENGDEYKLQSNYWLAGGLGKVLVSDDEKNISVIVIPNNILSLKETYLYIGNEQGLNTLVESGDKCPNYTKFPYKITIPSNTHSFTIPINNLSFESIFGLKRWGWLSFYSFN